MNWQAKCNPHREMSIHVDKKGILAGLATSLLLCAGIYFGSSGMRDFDHALQWYAVASVLSAFAVSYRFTVWAQRPPSRMYFKRGLQLFLKHPGALFASGSRDFAGQEFIRRRSPYRWIMHLCLSGGCTLAFAVTFPLVFGWIHFMPADLGSTYTVNVFGMAIRSFGIHSLEAFLLFNILNISAILVLVGLAMAAWRRYTDPGLLAVQTFAEDILPLVILATVAATGLMLAASYKYFGGMGHPFLSLVHWLTVITLLFYIPFGKLFHIVQRTCALCVAVYKKEGAQCPQVACHCCQEPFASQMHVDDLKSVLDELGFDYRFQTPSGEVHYQNTCPPCRRKLLVASQGSYLGR
jgi:NNP family nitrate/nitrite transporter-like MFS transporter